MKKIMISLVIFIIVAIGLTAGLIQYKKSGVVNISPKSGEFVSVIQENQNIETVEDNKEKTIDLYATYSENDLLIEKIDMSVDGFNESITIPQINGLKDKAVEQKVNSSIQETIKKALLKYTGRDEITNFRCGYNDYYKANFSNVISIQYSFSYQIKDQFFNDTIGLNYELIHGEKLKLEDIFKENEDISTIARVVLYKILAEKYIDMNMEGFGYDNIHYDIEKGAWYGKYTWYDQQMGNVREEEREYVPEMTEYDIERKCTQFMKEDNKIFDFTPNELCINIAGENGTLSFKDIADKVVIYNKYVTTESLYENSNIGHKNLLTCSAERDLSKYKETKFESENFFYDIDIVNYFINTSIGQGYSREGNYPAKKYLIEKTEGEAKKLKEKVKEYKKISSENKDKAYFLFAQSEISCGSKYQNGNNIYNNLVSTELGIRLFVCNITEKKEIMDRLFSNYRYHNLMFYGNIYNVSDGKTFLGSNYEERKEIPVQETKEKHVYDVLTGKEIKSVAELFKEGIDYQQIIRENSRFPIGSKAKYDFNTSSIIVTENDASDYGMYVDFSDMEGYMNLKELKTEIFPSNIRQIDVSELANMDKDELYRAYNEIFARHGHDFKMQEYKHYFNLWDWYHPINEKTVSLEELNDIEKYNVELIKTVIDGKE